MAHRVGVSTREHSVSDSADEGISANFGDCQCRNVSSLTLWQVETCFNIMTNAKHFILCSWKRNIYSQMLGLRYFTMLCNDAEYKNMDQPSKDLLQAKRLGLLICFYNIFFFNLDHFELKNMLFAIVVCHCRAIVTAQVPWLFLSNIPSHLNFLIYLCWSIHS